MLINGKRSILAAFMAVLLVAVRGIPLSAQETEEDGAMQVQFMDIGFGSSSNRILEDFSSLYRDADGQIIRPSFEHKTLADGSQASEILFSGVDAGGIRSDIGYYFLEDRLAAVVGERFSEAADLEQIRADLSRQYGAPFGLALASLGRLSELIGADAHLTEGQDAWTYAIRIDAFVPAEVSEEELPESQEGKAIGTVSMEDGHLFISMFADPSLLDGSSAKADRQSLSGLDGTEDLTDEEKEKLSQYMDFLQYRMKCEAEEYIAYLKSLRNQQ